MQKKKQIENAKLRGVGVRISFFLNFIILTLIVFVIQIEFEI